MHFLKRSMSFTRFQVVGKFAFAQERFQEALQMNGFRDLSEMEEAEESIGWVSPENCLQPALVEQVLVEPYFRLVMRVDKRKVSSALYAAHLAIEESAALEGSEKKKLSLNEKKELKFSVRKFLLQQTSPSNAFYRALWNFRTKTCYLLSTSSGVQERFCKLFRDSFGLDLEPVTPWSLAYLWAQDHKLTEQLHGIEQASFLGKRT